MWWHAPPDAKARPVVILSREETIDFVYDLIVCPASGAIRGLDTEIELGPEDGMPQECVVNLANTASADKSYLTGQLTELSAPKMNEVCRALNRATGCG